MTLQTRPIWPTIVQWVAWPNHFLYLGTKVSILVGRCLPWTPKIKNNLELIPYKITNWDRPLDNVKISFRTLFSVPKYEGCWVNCQRLVKSSRIDVHVESNKAALEHETRNLSPKFGPDIRKGFVQQSNLDHKCPLSGITKSVLWIDKIVHSGGLVPPTTPKNENNPGVIPYKVINWDRPFDKVKILFVTLFSISKCEGCCVNCQCSVKASDINAQVQSN